MTNTQKLITVEELKQASTIAEIKQIWERSKQPNSCESPMSERVAGGRLIKACIDQAKSCQSTEEAQEVFNTLAALGILDTPNGMMLLGEPAMNKWLPNCEEERKKTMEIFMLSLPV